MSRLFAKLRRRWRYRKTWGKPVGRDCISLDSSICEWLAERLTFLAIHHNSFPADSSSEEWRRELLTHAMAFSAYCEHWHAETIEAETALISAAQESLHWIADNLRDLWD